MVEIFSGSIVGIVGPKSGVKLFEHRNFVFDGLSTHLCGMVFPAT